MQQTSVSASYAVPTASLAVNKSRLKVYNKQEAIPTYYLKTGQEFQIELFNPTNKTVLAKISLNNNVITQGGLIIKPGRRVFLERYIDVPNKFRFETYNVSNTEEVRKAIEENGDFKVQFYREKVRNVYTNYPLINVSNCLRTYNTPINYTDFNNTNGGYVKQSGSADVNSFYCQNISDTSSSLTTSNVTTASYSTDVTLDSMSFNDTVEPLKKLSRSLSKKSKEIETGRVEQGSHSDQEFTTVNMEFEYFAFHTVQYKLLPISQKQVTDKDLNVKLYCTQCGSKVKAEYKFCPKCGTAS